MKTTIHIEVEKSIDNLEFGYWNSSREEFIPIDGMTDKEKEEAGRLLGLTQPGLDALVMFSSSLVEWLGKDLEDIWRRLDKAGIE